MKKKVLAGIMTTAMIMAMMTGCGSSDTAKDTQASTGSETSADSSAAESDYTIGISQFAEHGSLDNCREFLQVVWVNDKDKKRNKGLWQQ